MLPITAFTSLMPDLVRRLTGQAITVCSAAITGVLSWRAMVLTLDELTSARVDMRSISIPAWVLYAMLAVGLFLMAIEFLRMVLRGSFYTGVSGGH